MRAELSYFSQPAVQTSVEEHFEEVIHPLGDLKPRGQNEFFIPGSTEHYLDLSKMRLLVSCKVKNADSSALSSSDKLSTCDSLMAALFKSIRCMINGVEMSDKATTYPYKAHIQDLLNFNLEEKVTLLSARGFHDHEPTQTDTDYTSYYASTTWKPGYDRKNQIIQKGSDGTALEFELMGPLAVDVFNTPNYLPNGVNVHLTLTRTADDFVLLSGDGTTKGKNFHIEITQAKLFVTRVKLYSAVANEIQKLSIARPMRFPFKRTKCYDKTIAANQQIVSVQHLMKGSMPSRVIIGLVKNSAFSEDKLNDPLHFESFNLTEIQLKAGKQILPKNPLQLNFDETAGKLMIVEGYQKLLESLGYINTPQSVGFAYTSWAAGGKTLFGFDLTADKSAGVNWEPAVEGEISISLRFADALEDTVTVLTFCEWDEQFTIDDKRKLTYSPLFA